MQFYSKHFHVFDAANNKKHDITTHVLKALYDTSVIEEMNTNKSKLIVQKVNLVV